MRPFLSSARLFISQPRIKKHVNFYGPWCARRKPPQIHIHSENRSIAFRARSQNSCCLNFNLVRRCVKKWKQWEPQISKQSTSVRVCVSGRKCNRKPHDGQGTINGSQVRLPLEDCAGCGGGSKTPTRWDAIDHHVWSLKRSRHRCWSDWKMQARLLWWLLYVCMQSLYYGVPLRRS
jgi:hypothetical protein